MVPNMLVSAAASVGGGSTTTSASTAIALATSSVLRGGAVEAAASATSGSVSALVGLAGKLAPAASLVLFLAPLPTIQSIIRKRKVGDLPLLPYSSMTANAFLWTMYGLLKNEFKVWFANGVGLFMAMYYFFQFTRFAPKASPTLPGSVRKHVQITFGLMVGAIATILAPTLSRAQSASLIGTTAVAICLAMFASPLAALSTVIKNKSAESIPLPLSIATTINCFLWAAVGIFDMKDVNVIIPNVLGLLCGLAQLALIAIFSNGPSSNNNVAPVSSL